MKELLGIIKSYLLLPIISLIVISAGFMYFLNQSKSHFDPVEYNAKDWVTTSKSTISYSFDKDAKGERIGASVKIKPLAKTFYKKVIVELPDGRRGCVDTTTLSGAKNPKLLSNVPLIDEHVLGFKFMDIRDGNPTLGKSVEMVEKKVGDAIFVKKVSSTELQCYYSQIRCMTDTSLSNGAWITYKNGVVAEILSPDEHVKNTWVTKMPMTIEMADRFLPFVESIYETKPYDVFEFDSLWWIAGWLLRIFLGLLLLVVIWIGVPLFIALLMHAIVTLICIKWAPNIVVSILTFVLATAAIVGYTSLAVLEVRPFWLIGLAVMTISSIYSVIIVLAMIDNDRCPRCYTAIQFSSVKQKLEPVVSKVNPKQKDEGRVPYKEVQITIDKYSCGCCSYSKEKRYEKVLSTFMFDNDYDPDDYLNKDQLAENEEFRRRQQNEENRERIERQKQRDEQERLEREQEERKELEERKREKEEADRNRYCKYYDRNNCNCKREAVGFSYKTCPCDGDHHSYRCLHNRF